MKRFVVLTIFLFISSKSFAMASTPDTKNPEKHNESELMFCAADAKACPDGSYVARDPKNDCKFKACPGEKPKEDGTHGIVPPPIKLEKCEEGAVTESGHECP